MSPEASEQTPLPDDVDTEIPDDLDRFIIEEWSNPEFVTGYLAARARARSVEGDQ